MVALLRDDETVASIRSAVRPGRVGLKHTASNHISKNLGLLEVSKRKFASNFLRHTRYCEQSLLWAASVFLRVPYYLPLAGDTVRV
jgi:hypothetical protein